MLKQTNQKLPATKNVKKAIMSALLITGIVHTSSSYAVLATGDILTITRGTVGTNGYVNGGSFFGMDMNGNDAIGVSEKTPISFQIATGTNEFVGNIVMGTTFTAKNSHTGTINASETPAFDIWGFFGNTGMDFFTTAPTDNGNGTLNFGGWRVAWNGINSINMGTNAWQPTAGNCTALGCTGWTFTNSVARFQSAGTNGAAYTLDYTAIVPNGDPSGFGNVQYYLHLVGNVTIVGALSAATVGSVSKTLSAGSLGATRVTEANLPTPDTADSAVVHQDGMYYDFVVSGLTGGEQVNVVIPLSTPLPSGAIYRKYNSGWSTFVEDASNTLKSAPGTPDACPAVGNAAYTAGLTAGRYCIQLTILNGGLNDSDNSNLTISDPGGIATGPAVVVNDTRSSSTGGCSISSGQMNTPASRGDWWLLLGFVTWLGTVFVRRQRQA
jgi:hypothetical protein